MRNKQKSLRSEKNLNIFISYILLWLELQGNKTYALIKELGLLSGTNMEACDPGQLYFERSDALMVSLGIRHIWYTQTCMCTDTHTGKHSFI